MNQLKLTFLIFFFLISQSFAGIKVIEWNEEAQLTDYGRISKFLIQIQAVDLPQNVGINSFSITKSGDYIDEQVSKVTGVAKSKITKKKERDLKLDNVDNSDRVITALSIYYEEYVARICHLISQEFTKSG